MNILAIFIGGGIGAVLRYLVGCIFSNYVKLNLPLATFVVNIVGCLILGFLYVFFMEKSQIPAALKFALTVGFCGGLTTFSTFSLEIFEIFSNSQFVQGIIYIISSLVLGLFAVLLGAYLAKLVS